MSDKAWNLAIKAAFMLTASIMVATFAIGATVAAMTDSSVSGIGALLVFVYLFFLLWIAMFVFVTFIKAILDFAAELRAPAPAHRPVDEADEDDEEVAAAWHQMGEVGLMTTQYDEVYRDDEDDEIYLYLYVGTARMDYKLKRSDQSDAWQIFDYSGDQDRLVSVDTVKQLRAQLEQLATSPVRPATA